MTNTPSQRARELLAAEVGSPLPLEISIAAAAAAVEAALRLSAGADWVMVPREPTEAMRTAHAMYGDTSDWWQAVIAAAPRHEPGEGS